MCWHRVVHTSFHTVGGSCESTIITARHIIFSYNSSSKLFLSRLEKERGTTSLISRTASQSNLHWMNGGLSPSQLFIYTFLAPLIKFEPVAFLSLISTRSTKSIPIVWQILDRKMTCSFLRSLLQACAAFYFVLCCNTLVLQLLSCSKVKTLAMK